MSVEIIAELGINHNGDMHLVKRLIDVATSAGCDFVKFQKRDINLVYTKEELNSPRQSPWGSTFRAQKRGLELDDDCFAMITTYCSDKPIRWLASAWDKNSLDYIGKHPACCMIKIPSALITNHKFLKQARTYEKPIIVSTGMSTLQMIDEAIDVLGDRNIHSVLHCTSTYPARTEELNLNCIKTLKQQYPWTKIGFSNHHPGIVFIPAAVTLGAEVVEFHITLDRSSYGSDQSASIEPEGVHKIVKYIRSIEQAMGDGEKVIYDSEIPIMKKLRRN